MSKFYKYISEGYGKSRIDPISESDCKDSIRYNCKKSSESSPIWRGTKSFSQNYGFGDSTSAEQLRKSANTANYYTLIIDNSKYWSDFPPRSSSFVCTTRENKADMYGSLYRVFPFDGTPIAVCPKSDIWFSFKFTESIELINDVISLAAQSLNLDSKKINNDYKYLIKSLDEIGKDFKNKDGDPSWFKMTSFSIKPFFNDYLESDMPFSKFLIEKMAPKQNGFKLVKAGNKLPGRNEVWFSGKAIFIKNSELNSILDEYESIEKWANDVKQNRYIEDMIT